MSCSSVLTGGDKGNLSVVGTVFDKLNQVYKEYLDAEQVYTAVGYSLFYYTVFSVYECNIYIIFLIIFLPSFPLSSGYGIRAQSLQHFI